MFGKREVRSLERGPVVALFAVILPGCARKLTLVFVFVAINALRELDFVAGILAGRRMTGSARYLLMREHYRIVGFGMIRNSECSRDPTLHRVATLAAAAIGPLEELAAMRIGLVAVCAGVVRDGGLEVRILMAGQAWNVKVLSKQREFRLGVVKCRREL